MTTTLTGNGRKSTGLAWISAAVGATIGYWLFGQNQAYLGTTPLVSLALAPAVATVVWASTKGQPRTWIFSPIGLLVTYLWIATLGTPLLWSTGLASPWDDYPRDQHPTVFMWAVGLTALIHFGSVVGTVNPPLVPPPIHAVGRSVEVAAALSLGALGVSLALLLARTGGMSYLLTNLLDKRDLLVGLGPLTSIAATCAVAAIYVAEVGQATRRSVQLGLICGAAYLTYLFLLGSRFPMLAFVLALGVARVSTGRWPRTLFAVFGAAVIPFSVWYSVQVRGGQVLDKGTQGFRASLGNVIDPFSYGGLDVLHTLGGVLRGTPELVRFDSSAFAANLTTMLPRSAWPGKPPGFSVGFSEEYFPREWARGSGVPPSILAEFVHMYGVLGACFACFALGVILTRLGAALRSADRLFPRLYLPFLTVDCIVLAKSGSDAFLQQATLHAVAVSLFLVFIGIGRSLGQAREGS